MVIDAAANGVHPAHVHAWYLCGMVVTLDNWHYLDEQGREEYTKAIAATAQIHGRPLTPVPDLSKSKWGLEDMLTALQPPPENQEEP